MLFVFQVIATIYVASHTEIELSLSVCLSRKKENRLIQTINLISWQLKSADSVPL